jgi:monoamine oxidase
MKTETLIIGGGLSGLAVARELQRRNRSFQLIEARQQLGGRILARSVSLGDKTAAFDLGPAWFWPGQERIKRLISELGLVAFEQYSSGKSVYEDERGEVQSGWGYASMLGSLRMRGGLSVLIDALFRAIPDHTVRLGCRVTAIEPAVGGIVTHIVHSAGDQHMAIRSRRVVLAVPPRLAVASIKLEKAVPHAGLEIMASIPTWMASHAKIVAVYERPFWREAGLSGDAQSRRGPLMEVHDASPREGGPYALFGFVGVPAKARTDARALRHASQQHLGRLFGPQAAQPIDLILKDWALDDLTAAPRDQEPLFQHPVYGLPEALSSLCDGRLLLGSTETASQFGGYLEGALEAAERCIAEILN